MIFESAYRYNVDVLRTVPETPLLQMINAIKNDFRLKINEPISEVKKKKKLKI